MTVRRSRRRTNGILETKPNLRDRLKQRIRPEGLTLNERSELVVNRRGRERTPHRVRWIALIIAVVSFVGLILFNAPGVTS